MKLPTFLVTLPLFMIATGGILTIRFIAKVFRFGSMKVCSILGVCSVEFSFSKIGCFWPF
jgi:hypothetical protein